MNPQSPKESQANSGGNGTPRSTNQAMFKEPVFNPASLIRQGNNMEKESQRFLSFIIDPEVNYRKDLSWEISAPPDDFTPNSDDEPCEKVEKKESNEFETKCNEICFANKPWTDPEFGPVDSSLYAESETPGMFSGVTWKRIMEIVPQARLF